MMVTRLGRAQPYALSLFRIVVGLLFTCHGVASLFGVLGRPMLSMRHLAGVVRGRHPTGRMGILVTLGLGTRTAASLGSGSMAFAYFDVHQQTGLLPIQNGGEAAVFFCWTLLLLVFTGPGALAADRLFTTPRSAARRDTGTRREHHLGVPV